MTIITSTEARKHFTNILIRVSKDKERITAEDVELLERIEDAVDTAEAREALKEVEGEGVVSWGEAKKELGL